MTDYLLDTDTASRLMRSDRATVRNMRTSGASNLAVSTVTASELLFGAHIRPMQPDLMRAVRAFLGRVRVVDWDETAAEHHASVRHEVRRAGRRAGTFDIMIAAHARAVGRTLVSSDQAIGNLGISGLVIEDWSQ